MERYEEIEKGIETKDIRGLREAIGTLIYANRDFSKGIFDEVVQYVEDKGIKLKDDSLVGGPIISATKNSYTNDDFSRAVFELKRNFCDERIEDVKTIGRALYGKKPKEEETTGDARRPKEKSHNSTSQIGIVVVIAAIIICLVKLLK